LISKKKSSPLKPLGQMNRNLVGNILGRSSIKIAKDIKGFQIKIDEKTHSIKISQLADDTTLFCTSKEEIYI
jgi:hypothetical protein